MRVRIVWFVAGSSALAAIAVFACSVGDDVPLRCDICRDGSATDSQVVDAAAADGAATDAAAEAAADAAADAGPTCTFVLDPSFGDAGVVRLASPPSPEPAAIAVLAGGQLAVAGTDPSSGGILAARYSAGGDLDATFGTGGVTSFGGSVNGGSAEGIAAQTDGKLVVVGYGLDASDTYVWQVARLDTSGALDATFGTGGFAPAPPGGPAFGADVAVLADGSIVVAGAIDNGTIDRFVLVKYTSAGQLDATFGSGGVVVTAIGPGSALARALAIRPDGTIVVLGRADLDVGATTEGVALARYSANGALDATFGSAGTTTFAVPGSARISPRSMVVAPDGSIAVAGSTTGGSSDFFLARFTVAGTIDPSFGTAGAVKTDFFGGYDTVGALRLQPNGGFAVSGSVSLAPASGSTTTIGIAGYTATGQLDPGFADGGRLVTPMAPCSIAGIDVAATLAGGKLLGMGYGRIPTGPATFDEVLDIVRYDCK
ncbi:MAG TPA: hypothetical protein VIF62_05605 [Labilithrix sp.]|jgi:uncharacterized delta-60 repeat protein